MSWKRCLSGAKVREAKAMWEKMDACLWSAKESCKWHSPKAFKQLLVFDR